MALLSKTPPHIFFINPWIHDFAAYDVWSRPLGLLQLAGMVRSLGFSVSYIDCLNRFHPKLPESDFLGKQGRGPYHKTPIPKPNGLKDIPRTFSRYGIEPDWFLSNLAKLPQPDLIFVTSLMSYWYPGVKETITYLKQVFPATPILLGGIYASLWFPHAQKVCGATEVISHYGEIKLASLFQKYLGTDIPLPFNPLDINTWPYPAFDLQPHLNHVPLQTSRGCPFSCEYCASNFLSPSFEKRNWHSVIAEVRHWYENFGVSQFSFYDDAFLVDATRHAIPFLNALIELNYPITFHTPNALHLQKITPQIASLLYQAGFRTVRLGLETTHFADRTWDQKASFPDMILAFQFLKDAGFTQKEVGTYLLAGLPYQNWNDIFTSIEIILSFGITPIPTYYTPIPHTKMWEIAKQSSRYDLEKDPIFTNNTILPCQKEPFSWRQITSLKEKVQQEQTNPL